MRVTLIGSPLCFSLLARSQGYSPRDRTCRLRYAAHENQRKARYILSESKLPRCDAGSSGLLKLLEKDGLASCCSRLKLVEALGDVGERGSLEYDEELKTRCRRSRKSGDCCDCGGGDTGSSVIELRLVGTRVDASELRRLKRPFQ